MPFACGYPSSGNESQRGFDSFGCVQEEGEVEVVGVQFFTQQLPVLPVPLAADEEVLWCLLGPAGAEGTVRFSNPVEVGPVVSVSQLKLVEGRGQFPLGSRWDGQSLPSLPLEPGRVGVWILLDGLGGVPLQ